VIFKVVAPTEGTKEINKCENYLSRKGGKCCVNSREKNKGNKEIEHIKLKEKATR
jgi:hypothetical protein